MTDRNKARTPFGVLVIHGFTGTLDSVSALSKPLKELGIAFKMPLLAGHGAASPDALRGVGWDAWMADADRAFQELALDAERIIVIGHSMGALIALNLAVRYQGQVDSLVLATPAIKLVSLFAPGRPLHFAARIVSRVVKKWELKAVFAGQRIPGCVPHYAWVPTDAVISLFELIEKSLMLIDRVNVPALIVHNRRESTVLPESATILYNRIGTDPSEKSIIWLERSDHQIFCDCERDHVVQTITGYISDRIALKKDVN